MVYGVAYEFMLCYSLGGKTLQRARNLRACATSFTVRAGTAGLVMLENEYDFYLTLSLKR